MKTASKIIAICLTLPIWYYIMYYILTQINASELVWFLYWVYVPFGVFVNVVNKLIEKE
jgi:hypothetical protein